MWHWPPFRWFGLKVPIEFAAVSERARGKGREGGARTRGRAGRTPSNGVKSLHVALAVAALMGKISITTTINCSTIDFYLPPERCLTGWPAGRPTDRPADRPSDGDGPV